MVSTGTSFPIRHISVHLQAFSVSLFLFLGPPITLDSGLVPYRRNTLKKENVLKFGFLSLTVLALAVFAPSASAGVSGPLTFSACSGGAVAVDYSVIDFQMPVLLGYGVREQGPPHQPDLRQYRYHDCDYRVCGGGYSPRPWLRFAGNQQRRFYHNWRSFAEPHNSRPRGIKFSLFDHVEPKQCGMLSLRGFVFYFGADLVGHEYFA